MSDTHRHARDEHEPPSRRSFFSSITSWLMLGGLGASYGACSAMSARYLFPARPRAMRWLFVARVDALRKGESLAYTAPTGEAIAVARRGEAGGVEDFVALSSTCPHLGCKVHWEAHNARFFCPCHNGVFTPEGTAVSGPPADAGQSLPQYELRVEGELLFIHAPVESLAGETVASAGARAGHDPCLAARRSSRPRRAPVDSDGCVAELEAVLDGATAPPPASSSPAPCPRSPREPSAADYSDRLLGARDDAERV